MRSAVVALFLSACVVSADYGDTRFRCPDGVSCPPSFLCVDYVCQRATGDGGQASDASVGAVDALGDTAGISDGAGGDQPAPFCGKTGLITDSFDDNVIAPFWGGVYASGGVMVVETGGEAVIDLSKATLGFGAYLATKTADLTSSHLYIEAVQMVSTAGHAQAFFRAHGEGGDFIEIVEENGTLALKQSIGGALTSVKEIPYDNVMQRWWQLREASGLVYFETSLDGKTWTTQGSVATPPFATRIFIELGAGLAQPTSMPGAVHFDNLNGGGPATGPLC